jgi:hypothetical protein
MTSIAERLTRSYCLFHWLQERAIPEQIRTGLTYQTLEHELLALKIRPEDLAMVGDKQSDNFEESRLAFMVRYSGLTWSSCSIFCDAVEHPDWLHSGTPLLVQFKGADTMGYVGLPKAALGDFIFLKPSNIWINNNRVVSFTVRWNTHEQRRMERFIRLTSARQAIESSVHNIAQSEKFIAAVKATVGA